MKSKLNLLRDYYVRLGLLRVGLLRSGLLHTGQLRSALQRGIFEHKRALGSFHSLLYILKKTKWLDFFYIHGIKLDFFKN